MRFSLLLLVLSLSQIAKAQGFVQTEYKDTKGIQLRYAILKPAKIKPETKYPLLISLHGSGGRGSKKWEGNCAANKVLSQPAMRQKYPCYIIAPTVGRDQRWDGAPLAALMELIKSSLKEHAIDPSHAPSRSTPCSWARSKTVSPSVASTRSCVPSPLINVTLGMWILAPRDCQNRVPGLPNLLCFHGVQRAGVQ